ncbi:hypothetical protein BESB_001130 [Besnoitia besnoiti]|uniref:Transmembrane protein n=1 Tax=Besnoitia besnoiti TaxID=94643 RepID=A0A2A9MMT0_BESBE|nr:hypothetical protein BESB_001130 [Besnoitia besnoiti]PFH37771.1 hypothetical protein BESB_001130 [Besnoitia besnoiti]
MERLLRLFFFFFSFCFLYSCGKTAALHVDAWAPLRALQWGTPHRDFFPSVHGRQPRLSTPPFSVASLSSSSPCKDLAARPRAASVTFSSPRSVASSLLSRRKPGDVESARRPPEVSKKCPPLFDSRFGGPASPAVTSSPRVCPPAPLSSSASSLFSACITPLWRSLQEAARKRLKTRCDASVPPPGGLSRRVNLFLPRFPLRPRRAAFFSSMSSAAPVASPLRCRASPGRETLRQPQTASETPVQGLRGEVGPRRRASLGAFFASFLIANQSRPLLRFLSSLTLFALPVEPPSRLSCVARAPPPPSVASSCGFSAFSPLSVSSAACCSARFAGAGARVGRGGSLGEDFEDAEDCEGDGGAEDDAELRWSGQRRFVDPLRDAVDGTETAAEKEQANLFSPDVFFEFFGSLEDDDRLAAQAAQAMSRKKRLRKHFEAMLDYGRRARASVNRSNLNSKQQEDLKRGRAAESQASANSIEEDSSSARDGNGEKKLANQDERASRQARARSAPGATGISADEQRGGQRERRDGDRARDAKDRRRLVAEEATEKKEFHPASEGREDTSHTTGHAREREEAETTPESATAASRGPPASASSSLPSSSAASASPSTESEPAWLAQHELQATRFMRQAPMDEWRETLRVGEREVTLVSQAWGRSRRAGAGAPAEETVGTCGDDEEDEDLPAVVRAPNRDAWLEEVWIEGDDAPVSMESLSGDFFGDRAGWQSYRRTVEEVEREMEAAEESDDSLFAAALSDMREKDDEIARLLQSRRVPQPQDQEKQTQGAGSHAEGSERGDENKENLIEKGEPTRSEFSGDDEPSPIHDEQTTGRDERRQQPQQTRAAAEGSEGDQREEEKADEAQRENAEANRSVWHAVAQNAESDDSEKPSDDFWET